MKKIMIVMLCVLGGSVLANAQTLGNGVSNSGLGSIDGSIINAILHPESLKQGDEMTELGFVYGARQYCIFAGNSSLANKEKAEKLFARLETYLAEDGNVNAQDVLGNTALHFAAQCNNLDLANLLFKYDIEAKVKNKSGRTPLHIARREGYRKFAIALVQYDPELPTIMYVPEE